MGSAPIYLDYAATTPVDARVAAAMSECLTEQGVYGNPSSQHVYGRSARVRVERAREQVAALLHGRAAELIFTSGATESNNLAILGTVRAAAVRAAAVRAQTGRARHVVTARTEHKSVLDPCRQLEQEGCAVTYLRPDHDGLIDPEAVRAALRADTVLVSIMHANNEIGVVQDIAAIGALCRERGVPLHVDAAQSAGKLDLDVAQLNAQLVGFTAHKLYGPKGIGALYVAPERRAALQPLIYGGGQEHGLRAGTLPVHQIVGFGAACALAAAELPTEGARLARLRERLWQRLSGLEGVLLNGHPLRRVPGILNVSFAGVEGESLLVGLPELAVSTGSACNSDAEEPSYVLRSLGRDSQLAHSSLRFSLGRFTSEEDIDTAAAAIARELRRLRAMAPASAPAPVPDWLCGEAGSEQHGTRVRFELRTEGRRVLEARYRAYGCPHTLAACEWLAAELRGRELVSLSASGLAQAVGGPLDWARRLAVPAARLGRLLVIEDALRAALARPL